MSLKDLVGDQLLKADGTISTADIKTKYVGIYFSAHWCPPCRGFTPKLSEFYTACLSKMPGQLEIIFVSSDRDEDGFKDYYKDMPWLALPYDKRAKKDELATKYGVRGIPKFVILTGDKLEVVDADGRQTVVTNGDPESFPWS